MRSFGKGSIGTLHYFEATKYKAQKALIAAKFHGITIHENKFDQCKDANRIEFQKKNPTGKFPFLETDMGCIFSSNAIARYVARSRADTRLYGKGFHDEGQIDSWLEFCTHELEVPLMTWVYPTMGLMENVPHATTAAQRDVAKALVNLEDCLTKSKYLIGDFVSLADIVVICSLREGFARVFDPSFRKPFPKVCAWFEACCGMPQFKVVLGDVQLCSQAATPVVSMASTSVRESKAAEPKKGSVKVVGSKQAADATKAKGAAAPTQGNQAASAADVEAQIRGVGDEIRNVKQKLRGDGLSAKEINEHADIKALVGKLSDLKSKLGGFAASACGDADFQAKVLAVGDEIRALKNKLKGDGLSGRQINDHVEVGVLVAKLIDLKSNMSTGCAIASAAAPAQPNAPEAASEAANGGDVDAQIKDVGDQIRALKEKLKGQGLSGKKLNEHEEVKAMVAKLANLKSKGSSGDKAVVAAATAPTPAPALTPVVDGDIDAQVKTVGDQIRALKEKLKGQGLSGKKINDHAEVKSLVAQLTELKAKQ
eukprot:TRINITY_DN23366_c0_g1_i1.p1 TRINITY_DN23366_c0_g1~~TRINITY_DN23366_c0_g1_i1.p1  ORF type:complete len:562 (-),score=128.32 TRINITY_DN23366_c0_g1_i1:84-1703(-)